jgi:hypothetical protein
MRSPGVGLIALCAAMTVAAAADHPNFSGTWRLDTEKSQFGKGYRVPTRQIDTIVHHDPELEVTQDEEYATIPKELHGTMKYTTDGKVCTNVILGYTFTSTVKWDGSELVVDSKSDYEDTPIRLLDHWSLSADGKVLTVHRHFESPSRKVDQVLVFEKVE